MDRSPWAFTYTFSFIFFLQLPTLFPPGKGPFRFASPGSNLHHFYLLLVDVCLLKTEELRWGTPTATTPFEPLDFVPASMSTSRMRSSILGI
jgi:hypothetical protein